MYILCVMYFDCCRTVLVDGVVVGACMWRGVAYAPCCGPIEKLLWFVAHPSAARGATRWGCEGIEQMFFDRCCVCASTDTEIMMILRRVG